MTVLTKGDKKSIESDWTITKAVQHSAEKGRGKDNRSGFVEIIGKKKKKFMFMPRESRLFTQTKYTSLYNVTSDLSFCPKSRYQNNTD